MRNVIIYVLRITHHMADTHTLYNSHEPWFRGNLHCHTTNSDGRLSPEEVAARYAALGYDFLALTDHLVATDPSSLQRDDLLLIPGVEVHGDERGPGRRYHIVVFGPDVSEIAAMHRTGDRAQTVLARAREAGCMAVLAHPHRLGMTTEEVLALADADGIEIYNHVSLIGGKAFSAVYWDNALDAGMRLWGFADDDAHFTRNDYGGGWLMVQTPRLDQASILRALRDGRFYASTGPRFQTLQLVGRTVRVQCSPVRAIRFASNRMLLWGVEADGSLLTEAAWTVPAAGRYVRVEIEDVDGRLAWSQPVWLERF